MKTQKLIECLRTLLARAGIQLSVQAHVSPTPSPPYSTDNRVGCGQDALAAGLQEEIEGLTLLQSTISLIERCQSSKKLARSLSDLLVGGCDEKDSAKAIFGQFISLENLATELDIRVYVAQGWHSSQTNAEGSAEPLNPQSRSRRDRSASGSPTKTSYPANGRNVKQENPGGQSHSAFAGLTIPQTPPMPSSVYAAAQDGTWPHSTAQSPGTPRIGGGTVVMRLQTPAAPSSSGPPASSPPGSFSHFRSGDSTPNARVENEGVGHQEGKEKCGICQKSFTRGRDLRRHHATVHREICGDNDTCRFCGMQLSRPDAVRRHEQTGACGKRPSRQGGQGLPSSRSP